MLYFVSACVDSRDIDGITLTSTVRQDRDQMPTVTVNVNSGYKGMWHTARKLTLPTATIPSEGGQGDG